MIIIYVDFLCLRAQSVRLIAPLSFISYHVGSPSPNHTVFDLGRPPPAARGDAYEGNLFSASTL